MVRSLLFGQLLRYGIVGVTTNAAGFLVHLVVTGLGVPPSVAVTLLNGVGATLSLVLKRSWTFGHRGGLTSAGLRFWLAPPLEG